MLSDTYLRSLELPRTCRIKFQELTLIHHQVINDLKVEVGKILPQVVMTIPSTISSYLPPLEH